MWMIPRLCVIPSVAAISLLAMPLAIISRIWLV
jgi:hypothetical protein